MKQRRMSTTRRGSGRREKNREDENKGALMNSWGKVGNNQRNLYVA